jgi:hypothetical protein
MLISKDGFTDVLVSRLMVLDPSRVAAQIVTGVRFLGAGRRCGSATPTATASCAKYSGKRPPAGLPLMT